MNRINSLERRKILTAASLLLAVFLLAFYTAPVFAGGIDNALNSIEQGQISTNNQAASASPKGGIVACDLLNVRSGPGTEYPVIGGLAGGCAISIISEENGWWKINYNGGTGFVSGSYINTAAAKVSEDEKAESFTGTVTVDSSLNIRNSPWGDIIGSFSNGEQVEVVGKAGNWYKIKHDGGFAYVYADYIKNGPAIATSSDQENNNTTTPQTSDNSGDTRQRIVKCAENYIGSTSFRGPEVSYGSLACAQFVSTALKDAGVVSQVRLAVSGVVSDLKNKGWKEVTVPPFKAGDVITWKTYDADGDGADDDDSHVGIIGDDGQAISNSSSLKMPRKHDVYYQPISRVLRLS